MSNGLPSVGIDKIRVWPCTLSMDMEKLVEARGASVKEVVGDMMIDERSFNPAWEDPVTMAVNAGLSLLTDEDRKATKLLLVASESGPDQEKALSTWAQRYLDLPDSCRNMEIKHACYGGTASVNLAANWLLTQPEDTKALVITTDESRQHFHRPYEFVMGAGATAMLLSRNPRFLKLELGLSGVYTHEVSDLIRPTARVEAGHSETSLLSYLDAVDITTERYLSAVRDRTGERITSRDALRAWLPLQVYHAPFGGITARAHRAMMRLFDDFDRHAVKEDFEERVAPSLQYNRRMGGTYGSSVFISLLGLVDAQAEDVDGKRVGIYSYGSGSCAELYSGVFGPHSRDEAREAQVIQALNARRVGTLRDYEEAERERTCWIDQGDYQVSRDGHDGWFEERYATERLLVFDGVGEHIRQYSWSAP